jgi:cation diffusion facilitator CzcD-associated flavoprotein CzcO
VVHTSRYPHTSADFTGKRAAVVGTGATRGAGHSGNRAAGNATHGISAHRQLLLPARNCKVDAEVAKAGKADYVGVVKRIRESRYSG